jgi:succinate dehydrogenase hydrophobic anchor subunit
LNKRFSKNKKKNKMSKVFYLLQLLLILPHLINGFNIRQNSLKNIIATRAIVRTVIEKIDTELVTENTLVNEISKAQDLHIEHIIYATIVMFGVYGLYIYTTNFNEKNSIKYKKLNNIEMFSNIKRKMNIAFIVITIIFTRNIENAI